MNIRPATSNDIDFLVEAVVNAEKSGTDILSYSTIFGIDEMEVRKVLAAMITENEGYCELSIDSFLVAEINGEYAGAVAAWIEGLDDIPSAIIKANLLFSSMPESALKNLQKVASFLEEIHIPRKEGALQLESIYTVAKFRGQKIAKQIIEKQIEIAKQQNPSLNLAQIILSDINESALNAYKSVDFKLTLHKKSENQLIHKILPSLGNIIMEKNI